MKNGAKITVSRLVRPIAMNNLNLSAIHLVYSATYFPLYVLVMSHFTTRACGPLIGNKEFVVFI